MLRSFFAVTSKLTAPDPVFAVSFFPDYSLRSNGPAWLLAFRGRLIARATTAEKEIAPSRLLSGCYAFHARMQRTPQAISQ
jgi:hypothetical protein